MRVCIRDLLSADLLRRLAHSRLLDSCSSRSTVARGSHQVDKVRGNRRGVVQQLKLYLASRENLPHAIAPQGHTLILITMTLNWP